MESTEFSIRGNFFGDLQAVPNTAQGLEIPRMAWIDFDLLAEPPDINIDRAGRDKGCFFPHRVEELIACENSPAVGGEVFEQTKFAHCC